MPKETFPVWAEPYVWARVTELVAELRQVPDTEKQPAVRFTPSAKVELAVADVALNMVAERPLLKVEVAVPFTAKLPFWSISKAVVVPEEVDEPMANMGWVVEYVGMPRENRAQGVEEPMPTVVPLSYTREFPKVPFEFHLVR